MTRPVNVLARAELSFAEIAQAGAQRVSLGGALTWVAAAAVVDAARAILDRGDFSALSAGSPNGDWPPLAQAGRDRPTSAGPPL